MHSRWMCARTEVPARLLSRAIFDQYTAAPALEEGRRKRTNQIATLHVNAEYVRQSRIDPTPKTYPLFQRFSTRGAPVRASSREAQRIRAQRTSMREDGAELRVCRRNLLGVDHCADLSL